MPVTRPRQVGRYRLHEPIGQGGVARVYRATQVDTGRPAAVKVLTPRSARRPASAESIRRDIRFAGALLHPHIIFLYDHGIVGGEEEASGLVAGSPWVAMSLAEGSVDRAVHQWEWPDVARALDQLLDGLAHAHARGVVHGDIKPQNLLLRDGDLLIADFGMAGARRLAIEVGPSGGTPGFMAPEQAGELSGALGPWTDLYAVGATALSLTQGKSVPEGFAGWVGRLMMASPIERYRFACDAREGLARLGPAVAPLVGLAPGQAAPTLDLFEPSESVPLAIEPAPIVRAPLPARPPPEPRVEGEAGGSLFGIRPPPLIGRHQEREELWTLLRRVVSERAPRMVWLDGAPGVGVSRLAGWLRTTTHATGAGYIARVRLQRSNDADPLLGLLTAMLACRHRPDRVARAVEELGPPLHDDDVPFLRAWMSGRETSHAAQRDVVARTVAATAAGRVGLLSIVPGDDLEASDALANALLSLPEPLLVIVEGSSAQAGDRVHRLPVAPLDDADQLALLQSLVGELGEVPSWAVHATAGRPAQAVVLARQWVRAGAVPSDTAEGTVPRWADRFAELSASDQDALALATVIGVPTNIDEWQRACVQAGLSDDAGRLGRLVDLGLVLDDGDALSLAHPLLAKAASQRGADRSQRLHRGVAQALEAAGAPVHRSAPHRVAAGDATIVADQLGPAVYELVLLHHYREARTLLAAGEPLFRAEVTEPDDPRLGKLDHATLALRLLAGRDTDCLDRARHAAQRAERYDWPTRVPLLNVLGRLALEASSLEEARGALERALEVHDHPMQTVVATNLAMVCYRAGQTERGLELFERAAATATNASTRANAVRGRGLFLLRQAALDEAHACYLQAHELYTEDHELLMMSTTANDLGEVERLRGRLPEARRWFERAIHIVSSLDVADRSFPTANLALVHRAEGNEARADELLQVAHQVCLGSGRPGPARLLDALRAPGALAVHDWGRLTAHLDSAQATLDAGWRDPDVAAALSLVADTCDERPDLANRARDLAAEHTQ